jgi:hypothetical protein
LVVAKSESQRKNFDVNSGAEKACAKGKPGSIRWQEPPMTEKPSTSLTGTVEKIIPPRMPQETEKAQIAVEQADHLYKEIRIENKLTDADGEPVKLKPGAQVEVVVQAEPGSTVKAGGRPSA